MSEISVEKNFAENFAKREKFEISGFEFSFTAVLSNRRFLFLHVLSKLDTQIFLTSTKLQKSRIFQKGKGRFRRLGHLVPNCTSWKVVYCCLKLKTTLKMSIPAWCELVLDDQLTGTAD